MTTRTRAAFWTKINKGRILEPYLSKVRKKRLTIPSECEVNQVNESGESENHSVLNYLCDCDSSATSPFCHILWMGRERFRSRPSCRSLNGFQLFQQVGKSELSTWFLACVERVLLRHQSNVLMWDFFSLDNKPVPKYFI